MRLNALILVIIALSAYSLTIYIDGRKPNIIEAPITPIKALEEQEKAPDFSFQTPDGKQHTLRDFEGKIVILNFWASWCPPCIKEFPHLLRAAEENPNDVILIALSSDLDEQSMSRFTKKLTIPKTKNVFIALDQDQKITQGLFKTFKLPETILIDARQIPRQKIIGADWNYEDLDKQLELLQSTSK